MSHTIRPLLTALALLCTSCAGTDTYIINPDGSAKITMVAEGGGISLSNVFVFSTKLDAWSGIHVEKPETGGPAKQSFTAYVPDIRDYRINGGGPTPHFEFGEDGSITVRLDNKAARPKPPELGEDEVKAAMAEARQQFAQIEKMFVSKGGGTGTIIFHLPGTVTVSRHFEKTEDGGYRLSIDIDKAFEAQKAIVMDDATLELLVRNGEMSRGGPTSQKLMLEKLFGFDEPAVLKSTGGGSPLFDYAAEVAEAKKNLPAALANSGMYPTELPPKPASNPVKSLALDFARRGKSAGRDATLLNLSGTVAENVVSVRVPQVVTAVDDTGQVIFPTLMTSPTTGHARMNAGDRRLSVGITADAPSPTASAVKDLQFFLELGIAEEKKTVDLGTHDLSTPIEGGPHGLKVEAQNLTSGDQTRTRLAYSFKNPSGYAVLTCYDPDETIPENAPEWKRYKFRQEFFGKGSNAQHNHGFEGDLKRARFELEFYPDYISVKAPFRFQDIPIKD